MEIEIATSILWVLERIMFLWVSAFFGGIGGCINMLSYVINLSFMVKLMILKKNYEQLLHIGFNEIRSFGFKKFFIGLH